MIDRIRSIEGALGSLLFGMFPSEARVVANVTDMEEERSRTAAKDVPIVFLSRATSVIHFFLDVATVSATNHTVETKRSG